MTNSYRLPPIPKVKQRVWGIFNSAGKLEWFGNPNGTKKEETDLAAEWFSVSWDVLESRGYRAIRIEVTPIDEEAKE